jgi:hypothetical protein
MHAVGLSAGLTLVGSLEAKVMMGSQPMVRGYVKAVDRLADALAAGAARPDDVYAGLFEASHWLSSISDRFPNQFKLSPQAQAIRYARNVTHHNWASAVEWDTLNGWRWRDVNLLPSPVRNPDLRADYMQQLQGRPVIDGFRAVQYRVVKLAPGVDLT